MVVLSAIAWTLASTALLFVITPRMPFYEIISPRLVSFAISSITNLELNAKFLAGVSVENSNFVGAEIHSALVDLYYPDWNGLLQHIGHVEEAKTFHGDENGDLKQTWNDKENGTSVKNNKSVPKIVSAKQPEQPPQPIIKVEPRNTSVSKPEMLSIFIRSIRPNTYLNIMKDVYRNWGSIDILSSGVAHVKSPLGIYLSLGVICDNTINLFSFPLKVIGKQCQIDGISTGWTSIVEHSEKIRHKTLKMFGENNGRIFDNRTNVDNEDDNRKNSNDNSQEIMSDPSFEKNIWDFFRSDAMKEK